MTSELTLNQLNDRISVPGWINSDWQQASPPTTWMGRVIHWFGFGDTGYFTLRFKIEEAKQKALKPYVNGFADTPEAKKRYFREVSQILAETKETLKLLDDRFSKSKQEFYNNRYQAMLFVGEVVVGAFQMLKAMFSRNESHLPIECKLEQLGHQLVEEFIIPKTREFPQSTTLSFSDGTVAVVRAGPFSFSVNGQCYIFEKAGIGIRNEVIHISSKDEFKAQLKLLIGISNEVNLTEEGEAQINSWLELLKQIKNLYIDIHGHSYLPEWI